MDLSTRLSEVRHVLLSQWFSLPLLRHLLVSQDGSRGRWGRASWIWTDWWQLETEALFVGDVNIDSGLLYSLIWYDAQVLSSPDDPATGCFGPYICACHRAYRHSASPGVGEPVEAGLCPATIPSRLLGGSMVQSLRLASQTLPFPSFEI